MSSREVSSVLAQILSHKGQRELDEESLFDAYYVFCRHFGYIPFEEFMRIKYRVLEALFSRLQREYEAQERALRKMK